MFLGIIYVCAVFLLLFIHGILSETNIPTVVKQILAILFGALAVFVSVHAFNKFCLCNSLGLLLATIPLFNIYLTLIKNDNIFKKIFLAITLLYLVFGIIYFVMNFEVFQLILNSGNKLSLIFGISVYVFAMCFANMIAISKENDNFIKLHSTLMLISIIAMMFSAPQLACNSCTSPSKNNDDDILTRNPANRCECGGYKNANDSYCDKCWLDKLGY